jgi:hypothetical protein
MDLERIGLALSAGMCGMRKSGFALVFRLPATRPTYQQAFLWKMRDTDPWGRYLRKMPNQTACVSRDAFLGGF